MGLLDEGASEVQLLKDVAPMPVRLGEAKDVASKEEAYASATQAAANMLNAGAKALMKKNGMAMAKDKPFDKQMVKSMTKTIKKRVDSLDFDAGMSKAWKEQVMSYRTKLAAAYASASQGPNSPHVKQLKSKLDLIEGVRTKECRGVLAKEGVRKEKVPKEIAAKERMKKKKVRDEKLAKERAVKEKAEKEKRSKAMEKVAKEKAVKTKKEAAVKEA